MAGPPTADQLVVLAAPAGVLAGVRDTLQDWSALGLVGPFCWIEDPADSQSQRVQALEIVAGRATPVRLESVLASRDHARVRLCVLVPAFASAAVISTAIEDQLFTLVRSNTGSAVVDYLRCVVTRPGSGPGSSPAAREGWHNIVLSPEDSRGPGLGHQLLDNTDDPFEVGPPAAATVCGLTGLWAGMPEAPFDDLSVSPARVVRVARGFFRKLDADEVSTAVRDGVLSMAADLPKPRVGNGRAVTVEDVPLATSTMADQLWTKHTDVLRGPRIALPTTEVKRIGAGQALKMLFGFLLASIKNAPLSWYSGMVRGIASSAASLVHNTVFGRVPSAYQVVVNGRNPNGTPADWRDLELASAQINELVSNPGDRQSHAAHADLARVWRDYVNAAFTLADAGDRSPQLPAVAVGVDRGVVTKPGDCAPGPTSDFTGLPEPLAAADVLGVESARDRLVQARTDPAAGLDADRTLGALDRWAAAHQHSFAVQSGHRLGRAVTGVSAEIRSLLAALEAAGEAAQPSDELSRKQRRLAILLRVLLVVFLVVVIALVVLGVMSVIGWVAVVISVAAALGLWLGASFMTFLRSQRNVFAELNRRQVAASQAETNRVNLGHALNDLRRTTSAYGQHLAWSRVLGVVLGRPFGDRPTDDRPPMLSEETLPLGMRLGVAQPEPAVVANTNAQLRRRFFRDGWLTVPWEKIIADAPVRLGVEGIDLAEDPNRIYGERAGEGTVLSLWAGLLEAEGPGSATGDAVWGQALAGLAGTEHADGLLERVSVGPGGNLQSRAAFMSGVDAEEPAARSARIEIFDSLLFTPTARSNQHNEVTTTWRRSARAGLSQISVTVQLSEALPAYELAGLDVDEAPASVVGLPDGPVF